MIVVSSGMPLDNCRWGRRRVLGERLCLRADRVKDIVRGMWMVLLSMTGLDMETKGDMFSRPRSAKGETVLTSGPDMENRVDIGSGRGGWWYDAWIVRLDDCHLHDLLYNTMQVLFVLFVRSPPPIFKMLRG